MILDAHLEHSTLPALVKRHMSKGTLDSGYPGTLDSRYPASEMTAVSTTLIYCWLRQSI